MATRSDTAGVKSAVRTLDLIEHVFGHPDGLAAQQIATALAIPLSSLTYLLTTLVERGYLRREGRLFLPGEGLDRLSRRAPPSLLDAARPIVHALRRRFDETASLFVPVEWDMRVAMTETSTQNLRYAMEVGVRVPLHAIAAGKALLASYADARVDAYFASTGRARFTPHTLADEAALRRQLADIRRTGIAFTRDELTHGISGLGVAVVQDARTALSIGVAVPSIRMSPALGDQIAADLLAAKRQLEARRG
ncbi:IclR family transcriptional regulator [Sphingomonas metalli]|uniref:IclR family transcriptional regulator n=1 Tax=Sphingomonas metalli TaxID=1779358 RepID=A0A916TAW0_9SPHN|nr:IclR family transcriptional regulator [Sphingomonas metalli]GGB38199.1 IclR family transcriptional regulator [Sphingomonas metalli]